jgi:hypothetical protein
MVNILCFEENSAHILEAEDNASDHSNYCLYVLFTSSEIEKKKKQFQILKKLAKIQ